MLRYWFLSLRIQCLAVHQLLLSRHSNALISSSFSSLFLAPALASRDFPRFAQVRELETNLTDAQLKEQEVVQENVREATTKVANLNTKVWRGRCRACLICFFLSFFLS